MTLVLFLYPRVSIPCAKNLHAVAILLPVAHFVVVVAADAIEDHEDIYCLPIP